MSETGPLSGLMPYSLPALRARLDLELGEYRKEVQAHHRWVSSQAVLQVLREIPDYLGEKSPLDRPDQIKAFLPPTEFPAIFGLVQPTSLSKLLELRPQIDKKTGEAAAIAAAEARVQGLERELTAPIPAIDRMVRKGEDVVKAVRGNLMEEILTELDQHEDDFTELEDFLETRQLVLDLLDNPSPRPLKALADRLASLGTIERVSLQLPIGWGGVKGWRSVEQVKTGLAEKGRQLIALLNGRDVEALEGSLSGAQEELRRLQKRFDISKVRESLTQLQLAKEGATKTLAIHRRGVEPPAPIEPTRFAWDRAKATAAAAKRPSKLCKGAAILALITGGLIVTLRTGQFHQWVERLRPLPRRLKSLNPILRVSYTWATSLSQSLSKKQLYASLGAYTVLLGATYITHVRAINRHYRTVIEGERFINKRKIFEHPENIR